MTVTGAYTRDEDATILRRLDEGATRREVAAELGRTYQGICSRVWKLGLRGVSARRQMADDAGLLEAIRAGRADGKTWQEIADATGWSRPAVMQRSKVLGLYDKRVVRPQDTITHIRSDAALPAGHPDTWSAITAGTCLEGTPYPHPVFL